MNKSQTKRRKSHKNTGPLYWITVAVFLLLTLGPLLWAAVVSITPEYEMFSNTQNFFPKEPTLENYVTLFTKGRQSKQFWGGIKNSVKAAVLTLIIGIPCAVSCAYPMSRMRFRGRIFLRNALLITMAIPVFTTMIPIYKMFADFKLLDNMFWLSLVYVTSFLPITTWLISNYFDTIPKELEEAAYVDGCGRISAFFRIILPLCVPILFSAILMIVLMSWNQFQIPLILASSKATKPISIVASEFVAKDSVQYGLTTAAGLLAILPPAFVAIVFRKFLVSGITGGATKG